MQVPHESLDDLAKIDAKPKRAEPPHLKLVRPSGKREVLKPVARSNDLAKRSRFIRLAPLPEPRFSWYHRSLAFSGALALSALLLGIFATLYVPSGPADGEMGLVQDRQPEGISAPSEPDIPDLLLAATTSRTADRVYAVRSAVRSAVRRMPARPRVLRTAHRQRQPAQPPSLVMSEFVPTTLVIYIENGEIKTRIEPQATAGFKKRT